MNLFNFKKKDKEPSTASNKFLRDVRKRKSASKVEFKVFSANKEDIKSNINKQEVTKKPFFKVKLDFDFSKNLVNFFSNFKNLNYFLFKWNIFEKFNQFLGKTILFLLLFSLLYLNFLDRYFLVKSYTITFGDKSYLAKPEVEKLLNNINQNKVLGIFPSNEYLFINDLNLTNSSKNIIPEINSVKVTDRTWPNKVSLEIQTEPILLTLGLLEKNEKKLWRISQNGSVLTQDTSGISEKVVTVDRPVTFSQNQASFQDYQLQTNTTQVNRMWFTIWLWQELAGLDYQVLATNYPSLSDTDVILTTASGTKLLFDSDINNIPRETQKIRVDSILGSSLKPKIDSGEIVYIDFRIPNKRVFLCYKNKECNK